jgi:hypothetical protein
LEIIKAVLETIEGSGGNAPEGPLFLAFQGHGVSLDQYDRLVSKMVELRLVERKGYTLTTTPTGKELLSRMG